MRQFFLGCLLFIASPAFIFSQSIFENSITGTYPNQSNPYTAGQVVDPNISVSGIGRGNGLFGVDANNRYDAKSWSLLGLDPNTYFEFTIIPNADRQIDFVSFVYTGQISLNGPILFAFRSSLDGFTNDIGSVTATGATVSLSAAAFQDVTTPITFRFYGWGAIAGTGTFSINDFQFNGTVSCLTPQTPALPEVSHSCTSTSFVLNWPASTHASNYYIDVAADSGFVNCLSGYQNKALGNVLTATVTGLNAGGTYYVRLRAGNSCDRSSYSNIIKIAPPETIYNGSWSNGNPSATKNVRFSSNYNVATSFDACSCQIDNDVAVHVDSGGIFKLQNGLDVQGNGSLIFENNASLIQVNDGASNSGSIIYKRVSAPMKNFDFTYWSSPVIGQTAKLLSPNTLADKYFRYGPSGWVFDNGEMNPGVGFIIRVPKPDIHYPPDANNANGEYWTGTTYEQPVWFKGVPKNGIVNITPQGAGKNNLIGNPYPSAIDADAFINANTVAGTAMISGALYFWTHNTAIKPDGSKYIYSSSDYATYTLTGGTAATSTGSGAVPNGTISAGQSFFVKSAATDNFVFNNSMRTTTDALNSGNSQFFRMADTNKKEKSDKNRLWLNLTNSDGIFKQLLVGYIAGATNEMDNLYDGISYNGNTYVDFYSLNKESKMAIQGRALPFDKTDQVPLGFKIAIDGIFEIKIDHTDGFLDNYDIYLEDKNTGILNNLRKGPYSFSALKGQYNDRFVLSYKLTNSKPASGHEIKNSKQKVVINTHEKQLNIKSVIGNIKEVFIYDLKGQLLCQKTQIDKEQFTVTDLIANHQILIVKTVFENSTSQTDKILF